MAKQPVALQYVIPYVVTSELVQTQSIFLNEITIKNAILSKIGKNEEYFKIYYRTLFFFFRIQIISENIVLSSQYDFTLFIPYSSYYK